MYIYRYIGRIPAVRFIQVPRIQDVYLLVYTINFGMAISPSSFAAPSSFVFWFLGSPSENRRTTLLRITYIMYIIHNIICVRGERQSAAADVPRACVHAVFALHVCIYYYYYFCIRACT